MAQRNSEKETAEPIEEIVKIVSEKELTGKEVMDSVMPLGLENFIDNTVLKAEVIENFGKTRKGAIIEKKWSILKVLLDKKLIKLI